MPAHGQTDLSVCMCKCAHKATKRSAQSETNPNKRISGVVSNLAHAWTSGWFHVPIWLFSVPLSVMMSSKRVHTLEQHLTGFWMLQRITINDDGGYRGVITVHGGFHTVWMSKTPKRERLKEGMRKKHWKGGGVRSCVSKCVAWLKCVRFWANYIQNRSLGTDATLVHQ